MTFEAFWSNWPKSGDKGDKGRARIRFDRIVTAGRLSAMLVARDAYIDVVECERRGGFNRQYLQVSTFLGSATEERWRQYLPAETPLRPLPLLDAVQVSEHQNERAQTMHAMFQRDHARGLRQNVPTIHEILLKLKEGVL